MSDPILVIPHASVLTVTRDGDRVRIACPECHAAVSGFIVNGTVSSMSMLHEHGCSLPARIERAERDYDASGLPRWWL